MAADVLFLDVETPNGHNDRISSIGLIRCDCNGAVLAEDSYLVAFPTLMLPVLLHFRKYGHAH